MLYFCKIVFAALSKNYIDLYFAMPTAAPTLQYKNTIHLMQYSIKTTQSY